MKAVKGKGIAIPDRPDEEIFYSPKDKDWLHWQWSSGSGHWFNGYRFMLQFMRMNGYTGKITKEMAITY